MSSTSSIFLSTNFLLCLFLFSYFANKGCSLEGKDTTDLTRHDLHHTHHIVQISSLLPSNVCNPFNKGSATTYNYKKATLKVVHKHGPCFQVKKHKGETMTPADQAKIILEQDQSRVNSIHSDRLSKKNSSELSTRLWGSEYGTTTAATLPSVSAATSGTGSYIVTVGIGSPKKRVSLVFDTFSSLTWTQCEPCAGYCYKQNEPIFQPLESFTYANVSCGSQICSDVELTTGRSPRCDISTCVYISEYGNQIYSAGHLAKERLTITSSDVFNNFYFGCGQNNRGFLDSVTGVLGLGRDKLSIVSQTETKYDRFFSYCLPSSPSSTGYLSFGIININRLRNDVKFVPLYNGNKFYSLDMTGITVSGRFLPIPKAVFLKAGGMAIDPVTIITRLPPRAYQILRSVFRQYMSEYPEVRGYSVLDTCFDFRRYRRVLVPKISFFFDGEVEVELDLSGIFYIVFDDFSQVCLAFAANDRETDVAIFGNIQQRTLEVVYDVPGQRIGFGPSGCK